MVAKAHDGSGGRLGEYRERVFWLFTFTSRLDISFHRSPNCSFRRAKVAYT